MKKSSYILFSVFVIAILGGCTLSMEDLSIPEEQRGVNEPYTEQNDSFTVTYKYNDGVRPVTSNMLDYLATVEHDTILYFMDNIPKKWLPKVGEYVAAGCSRTLPHGLNDKVLSVENVGGMYKVVVTRATLDEVYDDLVVEVDFDYQAPFQEETTDSAYLDSLGLTEEDVAMTDWSVYDGTNDRASAAKTRASGDVTEEVKTQSDTWGMKIDTRYPDKAYGFLAKSLLKGLAAWNEKNKSRELKTYAALTLSVNTTKRIYTKIDKKKKYEKSYTNTETQKYLALEAGVDFWAGKRIGGDDGEFNITEYAKRIKDDKLTSKIQEASERIANLKDYKVKDPKPEISVPIPCTVPLEFVIRFNYDLGVTINGCVGVSMVHNNTTKYEGYEIVNGGDPVELKKEVVKDDFSGPSLFLSGSAAVALDVNVGVGIRVAKSLGCEIGGGFKTGIEGKCTFAPFSDDKQYADGNTFFKFYGKVYGFINFYVSPLGLDLWDKKITFIEKYLWDSSWPIIPTFTTSAVPGSIGVGKSTTTLNYGYKVKNLGIMAGSSYYEPRLEIYKGSLDDRSRIATVETTSSNKTLRKDKEYKFSYEIDNALFDKQDAYYVVPVIYNEKTGQTLAYKEMGYMMEEPYPKITVKECVQKSAQELNPYDFSDYEDQFYKDDSSGKGYDFGAMTSDLAKYEFVIKMDVASPGLMKEWGVNMLAYIKGKSGYLIKQQDFPVKKFKSGTYTLTYSFVTNYKGDSGPINLAILPYYIDQDGVRHDVYKVLDGENYKYYLELEYPYSKSVYTDGTKVQIDL